MDPIRANSRRRTAIGVALSTVIALAIAQPASASLVNISNGNRVVVTGEGSERNGTSVFYDAPGDRYLVMDTAGANGTAPCTDLSNTVVACPAAGIEALTVRTGASADFIALDPTTMPATVEGSLDSGTGDDAIYGGPADDAVSGGSDEDFLYGGRGADEIRGGGGRDVAFYADQPAGVAVTVGAGGGDDGNANDQSGAARDTVRGDIETLIGTLFGDSLVGDRSNETFYPGEGDDFVNGGRGRDAINGGGGNDVLLGDAGSDVLRGEAGNDRIRGGPDSDRLIGGTEDDFLDGGSGVDAMTGKAGIDRIFAKDGTRDRRIKCGSGANSLERVKRDRKKRVRDPRARSC